MAPLDPSTLTSETAGLQPPPARAGVSTARQPRIFPVFPFDWTWAGVLTRIASLPALLAAAYLAIGLVGHDPWKQDETYIFGIVQHILDSGDWIVPTMAGEPFMEKPPLYYWVAALSARLFASLLPLHDGARLATGLFMGASCAALACAGRRWCDQGSTAVLCLLSCLGVLLYGHLMLTDIPLLTGFALALAGLSLILSRPLLGGWWLGIGVGMGFMAKGMLAPGVLGVTALLLPALFSRWRNKTYACGLGVALAVSLPWLLLWPIALYLRSPELFRDWFWLNNIGRFFGFSVPQLGAQHDEGFWLHTLPWFTFPVLPLALLTLWRKGRAWLADAPCQVGVLMFAVMMTVLWLSASARDNYALPLLAPLALLAAPSAASLPAWADRSWATGARILFGTASALLWLVWVLMLWHGAPPEWTFLIRRLPQDFVPQLQPGSLLLALVASTAAVLLLRHLRAKPGCGLHAWMIGAALFWILLTALWLPWIDHAKSYRGVYEKLQQALPENYRCLASAGLGESERAMLRYFLGVNTQREENNPVIECDVLLVNGNVYAPPNRFSREKWRLIWEGARPGDQLERFWLFVARPSDG